MNKKISTIAIVTMGVVLTTMANIFLISPNNAGAGSVTLKKGTCTASGSSASTFGTFDGKSASSITDKGFTQVNTSVNSSALDQYFEVNDNWASCPSGYLVNGVAYVIQPSGKPNTGDGVYLRVSCCQIGSS